MTLLPICTYTILQYLTINLTNMSRPALPKKRMLFRNLQNIDDDSFHQDNLESSLFLNPASTLIELCTQCESVLTSLLENHASLWTRLVSARPPAPWCKSDITEQKRYIRRKLERCWRKSKLTTDSFRFVEQCNMVKNLGFIIKMQYWSSLVDNAESNQKCLC